MNAKTLKPNTNLKTPSFKPKHGDKILPELNLNDIMEPNVSYGTSIQPYSDIDKELRKSFTKNTHDYPNGVFFLDHAAPLLMQQQTFTCQDALTILRRHREDISHLDIIDAFTLFVRKMTLAKRIKLIPAMVLDVDSWEVLTR